jgi:hypothetical protein
MSDVVPLPARPSRFSLPNTSIVFISPLPSSPAYQIINFLVCPVWSEMVKQAVQDNVDPKLHGYLFFVFCDSLKG